MGITFPINPKLNEIISKVSQTVVLFNNKKNSCFELLREQQWQY